MTVSLAFALIGSDEEPRWVTDVRPGGESAARWSYCCEDGHYTPEAAAHHGAEKAAALLSWSARALQPPTCGAAAIAKLAA